jgi:L-ascorbate metabolism protein UlaG (beta-lactamase superfamily)
MDNRNRFIFLFIFLIIFIFNLVFDFTIVGESQDEKEIIYTDEFFYNNVSIKWYLAGGIKLKSFDTIVYIDPNSIPSNSEIADFIIITHNHLPHFSNADINKVSSVNTVIISSPQTPGYDYRVYPGDSLDFDNISFEFVPMYNVNKFRPEGELFHPPEDNGVGVIVDFGTARIYHAGDTDRIPEMREIVTDIALLPVSGYAWMTYMEAVEAVNDLKISSTNFSYSLPIHYGYNGFTGSIGSIEDAENFSEHVNSSVVILSNVNQWNPHELTVPTIVYPNGGEIISGSVTIQWNESIDTWGYFVHYKVYCSPNGISWYELTDFPISRTYFIWDTTDFEDSPNYQIKIVAYADDSANEDSSDNPFTVQNSFTTTSSSITTTEANTSTISLERNETSSTSSSSTTTGFLLPISLLILIITVKLRMFKRENK